MSEIFLKIINMSISASYIVLAVLFLRLLLKKAPKWITVVLWGIVAVRLVCPFSIESVLSLIPSAETVSPDIMMDRTPEINTGIPIINQVINPVISGSFTPDPGTSANPLQLWIPTFAVIWIVGMIALLIYTVISYVKVKRKIGTAVLLRDNIYQSENVVSPFVLGIIKPKIYLPFNMNEKDMEHVVAHEMAHIRRKDHLWKPLGFLLLTLHWFNPLMWLGYVLLCRDIELACDEKVIKELDHDARADYSEALLTCSVNRRTIAACPLAFGEVGVKDRVKSVLNYKKPAFWIIIAAVVACVVVAVCFLTNPPQEQDDKSMSPHGDIYTDYEGVYITIKSIEKNEGGQNIFNVVWHNETSKEVIYGEPYYIERLEGTEWVDAASEGLAFDGIGLLLRPNSTADKTYSSQRFDISKSGTYRLRVSFSVDEGDGDRRYEELNSWVEFKVGSIPSTDSLRELYPEYFGLEASKGLDVYVWQMAKNSYSFGLLPHAEQGRDWVSHELLNLKGAKAEEMIGILLTYNLNENDIYIIPWQNPISSYLAEWQIVTDAEDLEAKRQSYIDNIRQMLFAGDVLITDNDQQIELIYFEPSLSWVTSYVPKSLSWGCLGLPGITYVGEANDWRIEAIYQTIHTIDLRVTVPHELSFLSGSYSDTTPNPNAEFSMAAKTHTTKCVFVANESDKDKITRLGLSIEPVYEGEKRPTNMRVPSGDYTVSSTNLGAQVVSKKLNPGWSSPISMDGGGGSTDPNKDIEHPAYFAADLYLNNEKVATLDLTLQKGGAE